MKCKCGDLENNLVNPFSYWVIPGRIAAGEYPGNQFLLNPMTLLATVLHSVRALMKSRLKFWNTPGSKIGSLLDNGITVFIDLTESGERPSYMEELHRQRRKRAMRTKYFRFPIKDRCIPESKLMEELMEVVDSEVSQGNGVYIHCFRGLGRTGLAVCCYLTRLGKCHGNPIGCLNTLRIGVAGDFRNSPETERQVQFVRDWPIESTS